MKYKDKLKQILDQSHTGQSYIHLCQAELTIEGVWGQGKPVSSAI